MASSKRDVRPCRAASMDDDNFLGNAAPAAGADDGAMVVHSAHSSPSRGRGKFTWLRKVAYI